MKMIRRDKTDWRIWILAAALVLLIIILLAGRSSASVIVSPGVSFRGTQTNYTTGSELTWNCLNLTGNYLDSCGRSWNFTTASGTVTALLVNDSASMQKYNLTASPAQSISIEIWGLTPSREYSLYNNSRLVSSIVLPESGYYNDEAYANVNNQVLLNSSSFFGVCSAACLNSYHFTTPPFALNVSLNRSAACSVICDYPFFAGSTSDQNIIRRCGVEMKDEYNIDPATTGYEVRWTNISYDDTNCGFNWLINRTADSGNHLFNLTRMNPKNWPDFPTNKSTFVLYYRRR